MTRQSLEGKEIKREREEKEESERKKKERKKARGDQVTNLYPFSVRSIKKFYSLLVFLSSLTEELEKKRR